MALSFASMPLAYAPAAAALTTRVRATPVMAETGASLEELSKKLNPKVGFFY